MTDATVPIVVDLPGVGVFQANLNMYKPDPGMIGGFNMKVRLSEDPGFIYAIRQGIDGPIKIGFTGNPDFKPRLWVLQTASPIKLEVLWFLPVGHRGVERAIHIMLEHYNAEGEWFWQTKTVVAFVKELPEVIKSTERQLGVTDEHTTDEGTQGIRRLTRQTDLAGIVPAFGSESQHPAQEVTGATPGRFGETEGI